jgi:hypothetical protein
MTWVAPGHGTELEESGTIFRNPLLCAAALAAVCACDSADSADPGAIDAMAVIDSRVVPNTDAAPPPALEDFSARVADAVCDVLFRCCDDDLETYFGPHRNSDLLAAFHERLPPNATLDESECRPLVAEMLEVAPFGDWLREARAGRVTFRAAEFETCLDALAKATCGEQARAALFDEQCFAFYAPLGGDEQRSLFERTGSTGDACAPIRDGVGAAFYGTCDPHTHYCCYIAPDNPGLGCTYPFTGDGEPRSGTCQPVAATGAACSASPPLQFCATGSDCDAYELHCVEPVDIVLTVGDPCADDGFNLLGRCEDAWCDLFGSRECEAQKPDGSECTAAYECASGGCEEGLCGVSTLCAGTGA